MRSCLVLPFVAACFVVPANGARPGGPAGAPPPTVERGPVDPQLVGCWEWYNYKDQQTGGESYRGRLELREDGSFDWRAYPWGSSSDKGLPEFRDRGEWGVQSGELGLFGEGGPPIQRAVSYEDDSFHLDGVKQFKCR